MTRNSDLNCEDLFGCTHEAEVPISDEFGDIVEWKCRCGQKTTLVSELQNKLKSPSAEKQDGDTK